MFHPFKAPQQTPLQAMTAPQSPAGMGQINAGQPTPSTGFQQPQASNGQPNPEHLLNHVMNHFMATKTGKDITSKVLVDHPALAAQVKQHVATHEKVMGNMGMATSYDTPTGGTTP